MCREYLDLSLLKGYTYIFIFLFSLNSADLPGQMLNRFNKQGHRTGKWITYTDSTKTKKLAEGRYKDGNPVRKFKYYTMEGVLEREEITRFKVLKTTFYYPDGTRHFKGKARIDDKTDKIHYYFFGRWKYYDERGKLQKYCYYQKGALVRTVYVDKNNKTNDSLISFINEMDTLFQSRNSELLDSIRQSVFNLRKLDRLQQELYMSDTLTFHNLDYMLSRYGYPPKERVHEASVIPFYILSFAPTGIKEKYLHLLIKAANKGDIEWKSLAFYIDKIKVAKGEKQVYGTQYFYKNKKFETYPIEEPEKLTERRKQAGLPDEK